MTDFFLTDVSFFEEDDEDDDDEEDDDEEESDEEAEEEEDSTAIGLPHSEQNLAVWFLAPHSVQNVPLDFFSLSLEESSEVASLWSTPAPPP